VKLTNVITGSLQQQKQTISDHSFILHIIFVIHVDCDRSSKEVKSRFTILHGFVQTLRASNSLLPIIHQSGALLAASVAEMAAWSGASHQPIAIGMALLADFVGIGVFGQGTLVSVHQVVTDVSTDVAHRWALHTVNCLNIPIDQA